MPDRPEPEGAPDEQPVAAARPWHKPEFYVMPARLTATTHNNRPDNPSVPAQNS
jgi:hypothetical protein